MEKFSGKPEDLHRFVREWERHVQILNGASPNMPDIFVLIKLRGFLDEASVAILDNLMDDNPDLTYEEFWGEFLKTHQRDERAIHRRNWQRCQLKAMDPAHPTISEWTRFQSTYQSLRRLVDDWADFEDSQNVWKQTPPSIKKRCCVKFPKIGVGNGG